MSAHKEPGWVSLLAELLRGTPKLDGACVGRWPGLWDPPTKDEDPPDSEYRHSRALTICRNCSCLDACASWVEGLPRSQRPAGVVAGRLPDAWSEAA